MISTRFRGISFFVITSAVLFSASFAHAQTVNLIQNPGFENGSGSTPTSWTKVYWGTPTPTFSYPVAGHNSAKAAAITYNANSSGDARWAHSPASVDPSTTYTFSTWYKSNTTTEINIEFTNSSGQKSYFWMATLPSTSGAWKQYTASLQTSASARKVVIFHLIDRAGTLTVDDFSLVKGTSSQPPPPPPGAPTLTLSANPTSITNGQSSTLSWSSTNTTTCSASGGWSGSKATSGSQAVSPSVTTTYTLACSGSGGNVSKSATVTVTATPPPPPPGTFAEGMVTLSFDDSWTSQYTNALPILQNAGLKATFFLTTQPIQEAFVDFMTPAMVQDIANKGFEIAGHTVTHADLTTLTQAQINTEIKDSKSYLENLTGKIVTAFAYPYGSTNSTVKSLLQQAGYTSARGVDDESQNTAATDKYELKSSCIESTFTLAQIKAQIDAAKANKQWYILCLHEVNTSGTQYSMTPARLQEIVNYIKSSGIKVVTVQQGRALMAN